MKDKIINHIKTLYTEEELGVEFEDRICDYLDDDWDDQNLTLSEWYESFGSGEVEDSIIDEILKSIASHIGEPVDSWYFTDKYGDVNEMIYEVFPKLQKA